MNNEIIFITKTHHHATLAMQVNEEQNISIPIFYNPDAQRCIEIAREQIGQGAKVLISTDFLCDRFMENFNIPIVRIKRNSYSFISRIFELHKEYGKVAILAKDGTSMFKAAGKEAQGLFPDSVTLYLYKESAEIGWIVKQIKGDGFQVILGPSWVEQQAIDNALRYVFVPIQKDDYIDALATAKFYFNVYKDKIENNNLINALLNIINEGVIALDPRGKIIHINKAAASILSIDSSLLIGRNLSETLLKNLNWEALKESGKAIDNQMVEAGSNLIICRSFPIRVDNELVSLVLTMNSVEEIQETERKIRTKILSKGSNAVKTFQSIIGTSDELNSCAEKAKRFASVNSTVLITGPSGSGKEVFAQSIHNASTRSAKPFVVINCAALPESILESLLFGYEAGTFTGARANGKAGLFELAHGGTVFLDEVSEMPLSTQSRFLRVLQEQEVMRIGSDRVIPIDIRVIAATNKDLPSLVQTGSFREDLFYRLSVLLLHIPPLNHRREDIIPLAKYFVNRRSKELGLKINEITDEALKILYSIDFVGNVRHLNNILERAMVLSANNVIDSYVILQSLGEKPRDKEDRPIDSNLKIQTNSSEKETILRTIEACNGSKAQAARKLGISTTTLWRKMKEI